MGRIYLELMRNKINYNVFSTPILFLVFNRPENTRIVFNEIKKIKPLKLYIAADGPRQDNENDKINCQEVRKIIEQQIDWDCEVKKLYRDENLGCKRAVSSAINWFFNNEEYGIILEDDCVPSQSFFYFCEELLERYKDDTRIMMISGMNYNDDRLSKIPESYFFSNYYTVWGWATWKRAWNLYDISMSKWREIRDSGIIDRLYRNQILIDFVKSMLQEAYENKINTWDIQWFYSCLINNGLAAMPKVNLVTNIGAEGTHANTKTNIHYLPIKSLDYTNLIHPKIILANKSYDILLYNKISSLITTQNLFIKFKDMFKKFLKRTLKIILKVVNRCLNFFNFEINISKRIPYGPKNPKGYTALLGKGSVVPCQIEAYFLALSKYIDESSKVLDVGFGLGYGLNILSIKASEVRGVDVDEKAYEYCKSTYLGKNPKLVEIKIYNGYDLDYPDNYFEIVTCIDVLEHVKDYDKLLKEMMRVAKKGIFISTPNRRPEYTNKDGTPKNYWHLREWDKAELESILKKYGKLEWNFLNGPFDGPFTLSEHLKENTLTLSPFIFKS